MNTFLCNDSLKFFVWQVFRNYLTFCGLGLSNAQLFELSIQEYKKNQVEQQFFFSILFSLSIFFFRSRWRWKLFFFCPSASSELGQKSLPRTKRSRAFGEQNHHRISRFDAMCSLLSLHRRSLEFRVNGRKTNEQNEPANFNRLFSSSRKFISPKDSTWFTDKISEWRRNDESFLVFLSKQLDQGNSSLVCRNEFLEKSRYAQIARHVCTTMETLNLNEMNRLSHQNLVKNKVPKTKKAIRSFLSVFSVDSRRKRFVRSEKLALYSDPRQWRSSDRCLSSDEQIERTSFHRRRCEHHRGLNNRFWTPTIPFSVRFRASPFSAVWEFTTLDNTKTSFV